MGALEAVVVLGIVLIFFVVICSTIVIMVKMLKGGASSKGQKANGDEARMIQEIYQGLARMEERVESLETILMERERARKENNK
ncbi:MAG: phage-shock protein [Desulfatiglans sp.]|jgi:phage shock protein B|nr:phage-shock protein [Desulfatiglans sp.]